jgi:hypothetical protein
MNLFSVRLTRGGGHAACGALLVVALSAAVSACDSPAGLDGTVYTLMTVNSQPLPAPFPDPFMPPNTFEATAGTLTLRSDGTFVQVLVMRCRTPQPTGSECEVHGDGRLTMAGSYSRTDGWVDTGDRQFLATFDAGQVTIDVAYPPSMGVQMPRFLLEFRR